MLEEVEDHFGRTLQFSYDGLDRITSIEDPAGNLFVYEYDEYGRLSKVKYPDETPLNSSDNPEREYLYGYSGIWKLLITGIRDENGVQFATYTYDNPGRVLTTEHAGGVDKLTMVYNGSGTTTVTDALGASQTYTFSTVQGVKRTTGVSGDPCDDCGLPSSMTYDSNGYSSKRVDSKGNETLSVHNAEGLETCRIDGIPPTGAPNSEKAYRRILTTWHTDVRRPEYTRTYAPVVPTMAQPTSCDTNPSSADWTLVNTVYTDYTDGRLVTKTITDAASAISRTTSFSYYGPADPDGMEGQLASVNGPRTDVTDVTTYTYDTSNGNLLTITNALGHETEVLNHDAHGRPIQIEDPNGAVTTLTYHPRGWLRTSTIDGKTTTYDYEDTGLIDRVTLPTGAYLDFSYDNAHRMTAVADNSSFRIEYDLDAMSNVLAEEYCAGTCSGTSIRRTISRVFNNLSRLEQLLGGEGQKTRFTYDDNGNLERTIDPRDPSSPITSPTLFSENAYDALDRLKEFIDNDAERTTYTYDVMGSVTSVTDPGGLTTYYIVNSFGDILQIDSPDSGVTDFDFDSGGNRDESTDARAVTATYSYDALNRLTLIDYPGHTDSSFTYDQNSGGQNGLGRLTTMTDESGTTSYTYDLRGHVASMTTNRSSIIRTFSFSHDNDGKLDQITYPSGTVVDYSYDAAGRLSSIDVTKGTTTTVVNNITYEPFGPAISWDYGNGLTADLPVDSDYRIESVTHGTMMDVGYLYDDADNILDFDDLLSTYDEDFVYDDLNRLTDADGDYGIWTFQYDATGNRTYATQGLLSDTYSYVTGSNRLSTIVGDHAASYTYDANGNVIDDGTYDFFYGDDNRLYRIDDAGGTIAKYTHNAHGERVKKDTGTVTYYHYDVSGRLLAELDGSGNSVREYVYLEDRPIAFLDGSTIYYIHGDHLGTPHVVTNGAQTVVWQARYKPFGEANVVVNTVDFNLRYPGQYYDAEIGLHYNYSRDYDPSTGRYLQPDPIGLSGGLNTYAYVENNPIRYTDRFGLHHDGKGCVDGAGNRVSCPRDICATAECAAGILPNPPPASPEAQCNFECNVKPQIVCTGIGIGTGALTTPLGGAIGGGSCIVVKAVVCAYVCDDDDKQCKQ